MRPDFLGDSYDVVKRFLIATLAPHEPWAVHPMFTASEDFGTTARRFAKFLGAEVVYAGLVLTPAHRAESLQRCKHVGHLLLDPDTGVSRKRRPASPSRRHVYLTELRDLVLPRRDSLTVVYDQSFKRGDDVRSQLRTKLRSLARYGVAGFAYWSHASFLVLACDSKLLRQARERLLTAGVPKWRLVSPAA